MDMLPTLVTQSLSEEKQRESKQMLFSQHTTHLWLPLEPSKQLLPIKMWLLILLKSWQIMISLHFKVFFPTKLKNIWSMEMNALSIPRLQNKELTIGNSPQEMLLPLMFMHPLVKQWVKKQILELLCIKEKWTCSIIWRVRVQELSSLLSIKNTQLFLSPSEVSKISPELRSVLKNAWIMNLSALIQFWLKNLGNSLLNSKQQLLSNQNLLPYCPEEELLISQD